MREKVDDELNGRLKESIKMGKKKHIKREVKIISQYMFEENNSVVFCLSVDVWRLAFGT